MSQQTTTPPHEPSMWHWWPVFVGGFCGPLLAHLLVEWMPPWAAVAIAFFTMWVVVGLVFLISPPTPGWRFARWVLGGAVGAIAAGLVAFLVHM